MKLESKKFIDVCKTICLAIDTKGLSTMSDTLELVAGGNVLKLNVTNRNYYASVKFDIEDNTTFRAAVNAEKFIKLISKITSEYIDLDVVDNSLSIKGNGSYKLEMIQDAQGNVMALPVINFKNITNQFDMPFENLQNIMNFNTKEIKRGKITKDSQRCYYLDNKGCITYTNGLCVNSFESPSEFKVLLNETTVKLLKLFKGADIIKFTLGIDDDNGLMNTKVAFNTDKVALISIIPEDTQKLISEVPVETARALAGQAYPFAFTFNKDELLGALDRLTAVLGNTTDVAVNIEFTNDAISISDLAGNNVEVVKPSSTCESLTSYSAAFRLVPLLSMVETVDEYSTLCFGDGKSIGIRKGNVIDILPRMVRATV